MSYEITGQHRGDRGGTIATSAETPRAALDIARQWAEQGSGTSPSGPRKASPST
jgi:hypothetical protein